MQVTREELNPCTVKLTVSCDADQVKHGFDAAYRTLTKNLRIPGFRPGKAPRAMVEPLLDESQWKEEAADAIVRTSLIKAIEQEELQVDSTTPPKVSLDALDAKEGKAEYTAKIALPPKVELGDYKGLPVQQPCADVSEDEVEFELTELRRRGQKREPVTDRGAEEGDIAVVNLRPEDLEGEGRNFMMVLGKTFAQLDEALMGMRVEEMKSLDLEFPENFQESDWAGSAKKTRVTLNSLSTVRLPALDDAFAKSLNRESVEDLRSRIREAVGSVKQTVIRQLVHDRLFGSLVERSQVEVSDNMWENLAERRLRETAAEQAKEGKSLEAYAETQGMTLDELVQSWHDRAKVEVQHALIIQSVFSAEKMQLTEQELGRELMAMALEAEVQPQELLELLRKNEAIDELRYRTLSRKVGDFLLSQADVSLEPSAAVASAP